MKKYLLALLLACVFPFFSGCAESVSPDVGVATTSDASPAPEPVKEVASPAVAETTTVDEDVEDEGEHIDASNAKFIVNVNNGKLHSVDCDELPAEHNRVYFASVEAANAAGYTDEHRECMSGNGGTSSRASQPVATNTSASTPSYSSPAPSASPRYVGNKNNGKLHSVNCSALPAPHNRVYFSSIEEARAKGFTDPHRECMR